MIYFIRNIDGENNFLNIKQKLLLSFSTDSDLRKLKYQHELDTHLVLTVNDDFFCYLQITNGESKKINLITKSPHSNFKKLGESKYDLWIMQIQIRKNAQILPLLECYNL